MKRKPIFKSKNEIQTPFYFIKEKLILENMKKMQRLKELSGYRVKVLLALKCFSTWSVFPLMRQYMDGTTSSSLNELKLGYETFGKETHGYSVAYSDNEIKDVCKYADKIIFNSKSQLLQFKDRIPKNIPIGIRLNPNVSSSSFIIADPARKYSRLGEVDVKHIEDVIHYISGFMIHNHCENDNFDKFDEILSLIESKYHNYLNSENINWISLGGGIHFTGENYPIEKFALRLKNFADKYNLTIYLEPGEASITNTATLETTILDIVKNDKTNIIVDSSIEAHMLDLLIYRASTSIHSINDNKIEMVVNNNDDGNIIFCGNSCLAGDIFGEYYIDNEIIQQLKVGDRIAFNDVAGYTMVKKNWFNGVRMPSIVVERLNGDIEVVKTFNYKDFKNNLS